ncbi:MAG: hypothetical protein QM791_13270 [Ferruginibacter sp.]
MIYLIDDKKIRQERDYNWTDDRFERFKSLIKPIYTLDEVQEKATDIFQAGNIILYHESFLDTTHIANEASDRRSRLDSFSKNRSSYLVLFSGSKNTRNLEGNVANLPVSVLYRNLESFIQKVGVGDINLKFLLFGENPLITEELDNKIDTALLSTINEQAPKVGNANFLIEPAERNINDPLIGCELQTIFSDTDQEFTEKINEWLNEKVYDNIFIPLCFGNTLSDYNGLRLASHIRCSTTKNQTTRIFIYGVVGADYLLHHDYFNILKTKNTSLISFSKKAIGEAALKPQEHFSKEKLPGELAKLKLDVPQNYYDNHAVANEWGIYQMARNANIDIKDIVGFDIEKINSLYFKWLITKNNLNEPIPEEQKKQQREYLVKIEGPKILGKIELPKTKR